MYVQRSIHRQRYKSLRRTVFLLFFLLEIIAIASSQEIYPGTVSEPSLAGRTEIPNGINDQDQRTADTTPLSTGTSHNEDSTPAQSNPPVPLESGGQPRPSVEGLASMIFIAATISLSVIICLAFLGGMYCWYKHAGMLSSARRVFYRSSDSRVLIPNDYHPMDDGVEINHNGSTNKKLAKLAEKTDYPAYGVTGPNPLHRANNGPPIDLNLTRNAEVFHYQQQKQRLKKLSSVSSNGSSHSKHSTPDTTHDPTTDAQGDEENSDGEYTVYECPGLAAATDGPLEIHNPLFANSESNSSSYSATTLGGSIVTAKFDYSTTVGGR